MPRDRAKIAALLIEDDPSIVDLITTNLSVRGFDTVSTAYGHQALKLLESGEPDIVLLDLMLPDFDGMELCRQIRERSQVAVIVVSARGGERDKITALNMGADDYMTKPFSVDELLARIAATLRRTKDPVLSQSTGQVITAGAVVIDLDNQQVTAEGKQVHLTPTEFSLLRELVVNRGKLLSHSHLLRQVWGPGYQTETEYLRVYIRKLRTKLGDGDAELIQTAPRVGYRFSLETDAKPDVKTDAEPAPSSLPLAPD